MAQAVAEGLTAQGVDVLDIGLSGTEEMYFATTELAADGGICVTASHNPMDYNGMKMVQAGSAPIGNEDGMAAIKALAESGALFGAPRHPYTQALIAAVPVPDPVAAPRPPPPAGVPGPPFRRPRRRPVRARAPS